MAAPPSKIWPTVTFAGVPVEVLSWEIDYDTEKRQRNVHLRGCITDYDLLRMQDPLNYVTFSKGESESGSNKMTNKSICPRCFTTPTPWIWSSPLPPNGIITWECQNCGFSVCIPPDPGEPEMTCCNEEKPFVYMIWLKSTEARSASELHGEPAKILTPQPQAELGRTLEEVRQKVRDDFFKDPANKDVDSTRLEVVVWPFCR